MALYTAVVTSIGAIKIPQYLGGLISPVDVISYYKVGEGGWADPGSGRQPRTPDPSLTDLDIIMDASRAALDKRYNVGENAGYFQKPLVPGDFSTPAPGILRVSCMLLNAEYNLETDGTLIYDVGGPYGLPEIWEIGLFDQNDDMILYGTFSKETKDASKMIENVCRLVVG